MTERSRTGGAGRREPERWPKARCPKCKAKEGAMILYGMVDGPTAYDAMSHGVEIGGCVISEDSPTHVCRACGHYFRKVPRARRGEGPEAPPA